jgi:hypothetical protein
MPTKRSTSKPGSARKPASRSRQTKRSKKRIRRSIFKTDHWYAGAASSIGIAGRAKPARPLQLFMSRVEDKVE